MLWTSMHMVDAYAWLVTPPITSMPPLAAPTVPFDVLRAFVSPLDMSVWPLDPSTWPLRCSASSMHCLASLALVRSCTIFTQTRAPCLLSLERWSMCFRYIFIHILVTLPVFFLV
ncbi:hypothetical protein SCLCIDRAFT_939423 [Scleroderma citrinum Foug A]|uniref:Uncharacterized protein n=1 Tax=Scleroderma citrinum Foug A TaxID=1036808 RepID=A0A0C3A757_9AGAM|nr:hypothetical protein SCLCIDRAFT_939423 [Scleroderma citrinum Foug A]